MAIFSIMTPMLSLTLLTYFCSTHFPFFCLLAGASFFFASFLFV